MNYILKLLNINRTYIIIASLIFFVIGSLNNAEEKSFNVKDALLSFFPAAVIIEKVVNIENNDANLVELNNKTDSEDLLSDNNSIKSDFIL